MNVSTPSTRAHERLMNQLTVRTVEARPYVKPTQQSMKRFLKMVRRVKRLHAAGLTYSEITQRTGFSKATICRYVKR